MSNSLRSTYGGIWKEEPPSSIQHARTIGLAASKHATTDVLSTRKKIQQWVEEKTRYNLRGKRFEEAVRGIKSEDGTSRLFKKNDSIMVAIMRPLGTTSCGCPIFDPESGNLIRCCAYYQMGDLDDEDN